MLSGASRSQRHSLARVIPLIPDRRGASCLSRPSKQPSKHGKQQESRRSRRAMSSAACLGQANWPAQTAPFLRPQTALAAFYWFELPYRHAPPPTQIHEHVPRTPPALPRLPADGGELPASSTCPSALPPPTQSPRNAPTRRAAPPLPPKSHPETLRRQGPLAPRQRPAMLRAPEHQQMVQARHGWRGAALSANLRRALDRHGLSIFHVGTALSGDERRPLASHTRRTISHTQAHTRAHPGAASIHSGARSRYAGAGSKMDARGR